MKTLKFICLSLIIYLLMGTSFSLGYFTDKNLITANTTEDLTKIAPIIIQTAMPYLLSGMIKHNTTHDSSCSGTLIFANNDYMGVITAAHCLQQNKLIQVFFPYSSAYTMVLNRLFSLKVNTYKVQNGQLLVACHTISHSTRDLALIKVSLLNSCYAQ